MCNLNQLIKCLTLLVHVWNQNWQEDRLHWRKHYPLPNEACQGLRWGPLGPSSQWENKKHQIYNIRFFAFLLFFCFSSDNNYDVFLTNSHLNPQMTRMLNVLLTTVWEWQETLKVSCIILVCVLAVNPGILQYSVELPFKSHQVYASNLCVFLQYLILLFISFC